MSEAFTATSTDFLKYKKETESGARKQTDDAKKKEDGRGEKAAGAGVGKDFAGSPAPGTEPTPSTLRATVQCRGRGSRSLCDTASC